MSIIIKGMEMPKGDEEIRLRIDAKGEVYIYGAYPTQLYEAIELPPHGRLIDADTLKEIEFHGMQADKKISYQMGWNDAIATIAENAPTVIEAEGTE